MEGQWSQHTILEGLNTKQKQAVTAPCSGILQIIAGPGTGKTKVLVSRVAYLILHEKVPPENIIVTTFTKKAANEMVTRLSKMLMGTDIKLSKLLVGTFHSICYKIIQKYGGWLDLNGFIIADEKDSNKILSDVLSKRISASEWSLLKNLNGVETVPFKRVSAEKNNGFDAKKLKMQISSLKAEGLTPEEYSKSSNANKLVSMVYTHYQAQLRQYKLIDFDDCLLYCHKIVSEYPVLDHIRHTLVDEFQDTNNIQLRLMYAFARGHSNDPRLQHNVTIVGDPDQSIYRFRNAQSMNFDKMRQHYSAQSLPCQTIVMEENYRSTSGILQLSESVMRQQQGRADRMLRSNLSVSFKPVRATLSSSDEEARWIAHQIEYLTKLPGSVVAHSDITVLVRAAFQTRAIETEFVKRKIPYYMVRGKAFWDRKEVAAVMDYLRCLVNNNDRLAFMRTLNFPKKGFGKKYMADIEDMIDKYQKKSPDTSVFEILEKGSENPKFLTTTLRKRLQRYISFILDGRKILDTEFTFGEGDDVDSCEPFPPTDEDRLWAIEKIFFHIYHESGLQKEVADEGKNEARLNIKEVRSQLMSFEFREDDDDALGSDVGTSISQPVSESFGFLFMKQFIESVSLYDVDPGKMDDARVSSKVAISTIHGAKGLEWPIVFVPGVSEGLLPASFASRSEDSESINEERRCFFVALTRAKHMLFISSYTEADNEGRWGRKPISEVSRFMNNLDDVCTEEMELNSVPNLSMFYSLSNSSFNPKSLDIEAYDNNYLKQMRVYVKRENDEEHCSGFTSAGQVKQTKTDFGRSYGFKAPKTEPIQSGVSGVASASTPNRAPSYVPSRIKTSMYPSMSAFSSPSTGTSTSSLTSTPGTSSNRAPVYVPKRGGRKKRLGTR